MIGGERLEIYESYKYLGLWSNNSHKKFSKKIHTCQSRLKKYYTRLKTDSLISPILMYGSKVLYNGREQKDFEKILGSSYSFTR